MTYAELLEQLKNMTQEQLNSEVVVWDCYGDNDEFHDETPELVFSTPSCKSLPTDYPIIRF